jgi:glutamate synthase domain-containing protein 3
VPSQVRKTHLGYKAIPVSSLATRLVADASDSLETGEPIRLSYPIRNVDRAIGSRLSGEITARHGTRGLPEGTIDVKVAGIAGQSFGAWLSKGVTLRLNGVANDFVGKGMGGGVITVEPSRGKTGAIPHVAGNAVLYGATGGRAYLAGTVGQRFAVRNSGATAVVEGCSDHGCEYMTGGSVVVIGDVGRNFGAGMTGGVAYVWDPEMNLKGRVADTAPAVRRPTDGDRAAIISLLEIHSEMTGSPAARGLLRSTRSVERFWVLAAGESAEPGPEDDHAATATEVV